MRALAAACLAATLPLASEAEWRFSPPLQVGGAAKEGVFPHLEAAGRSSMAIAEDGTVAIAWEDNRDGQPRVYLARMPKAAEAFGPAERVSGPEPAYEPAVVATGESFLAAWEEEGRVLARWLDADVPGPVSTLAQAGNQVALAAAHQGAVYAAWSERRDGHGHIVVARLVRNGDDIEVVWRAPVEAQPPATDQLYPALVATEGGPLVAWEDRRHGHTRLYIARWQEDRFAAPEQLNELRSDGNGAPFGRGPGVTRVALARGGDRLAATWMDKRDYRSGYGIYTAMAKAGSGRFGANELAQDLFGDNTPQWHPDIAVSPAGEVVAAWDDTRDGSPDVWLSVRQADEWGDDFTFDAGSGAGAQTHPVIAFGPAGRLHIAWVHRPDEGPVEIRYARAERED